MATHSGLPNPFAVEMRREVYARRARGATVQPAIPGPAEYWVTVDGSEHGPFGLTACREFCAQLAAELGGSVAWGESEVSDGPDPR